MSDERPRWSFTWLLRVQRIGRNRREPDASEEASQQRRGRWIFIAVIGGIILAEVALGLWLGILPR